MKTYWLMTCDIICPTPLAGSLNFQGHSEGVDNKMNGFTLAFLKLLSSQITFEQPNGTRNIFTKSLGLISM